MWRRHSDPKRYTAAVDLRVSTCNSLSVTVLSILDWLAIGLVPIRVMQEEIGRGKAKQILTSTPVPGHRVSLCYQASELGPSLTSVLDIIRELIAQHRLFV